MAAIEALAGIATPAAIDRLIDELQREGPLPLEQDSAVRVALTIAHRRAGDRVGARLVAALALTPGARRAAGRVERTSRAEGRGGGIAG